MPTDTTSSSVEHRLEGFDLWGTKPGGYIVPASKDTQDEDPSSILSAFLGHQVALVMKAGDRRPWGMEFPAEVAEHAVSFQDFLPFHVMSLSSYRDAEKRIHEANTADPTAKEQEWNSKQLDITRFRPNIVIDGNIEPFAEDDWQEALMGGQSFKFLIRCGRCMVSICDVVQWHDT